MVIDGHLMPSGLPVVLSEMLANYSGREIRILTVGDRSSEALKAHGEDPYWIVSGAHLGDGPIEAAVAQGAPRLRSDVVIAIDAFRECDFPWLSIQELAHQLVPGGVMLTAVTDVSDVAAANRRLQALVRWADLVPAPTNADGLDCACVVSAKSRSLGLRRLAGSARQAVLLRLSRSHGRRRHDGAPGIGGWLPEPPAPAMDASESAAFTSSPPDAVYEHRQQVLAHLLSTGAVRFGTGTYGVPEVNVYGGDTEPVVVGAWTSIADDVRIMPGGNHRIDRVSSYPFRARYGMEGIFTDGYPSAKGPVIIGSDVWIGRGAVILSGAEIGDGAVVGAGAVVAGRVRPYAIAVGNPAVEVRRRFDDETVDALLRLRWWDWPEEEILELVQLLNDRPVTELLEYGWSREARQ